MLRDEPQYHDQLRKSFEMPLDTALEEQQRLRELGYQLIAGCWSLSLRVITQELSSSSVWEKSGVEVMVGPYCIPTSDNGNYIQEVALWIRPNDVPS